VPDIGIAAQIDAGRGQKGPEMIRKFRKFPVLREFTSQGICILGERDHSAHEGALHRHCGTRFHSSIFYALENGEIVALTSGTAQRLHWEDERR
jgi:hypothetical protein